MEGLLALHLSKSSKGSSNLATLSGGTNASPSASGGNQMSMAPFGHQLAPSSLTNSNTPSSYQAGSGGPPLVHSATWNTLGHPSRK